MPACLPPAQCAQPPFYLVFRGGRLLMRKDGEKLRILLETELGALKGGLADVQYMGTFDGRGCYAARADEQAAIPFQMELADLRAVTPRTGDRALFLLAGTASQILYWSETNRYCGRCGHATAAKADERARVCPACGHITYMRISPATITAVLRGGEILLAHNRNFPAGRYGLISGFAEAGETLEECVEREIGEEVGIRVKNIRYCCSQPWPFPDSLMLAFTAEYESGALAEDGCEITDAAWFRANALPDIPPADSVAGRMIRCFRDGGPEALRK